MEKKLTKEAQQIIDKYNKEYPNDPKKAEERINWELKYIQKYYYEKNEQERKIIKQSMKYVGQGEYIRKKLKKEFNFKGFSNKKETIEYIQQLERKLYYKYSFDRHRHCQYEEHWHAIYPNLLFDIKEKFDLWAFNVDFDYNINIYEIIDDIQYDIKKNWDKDEFSHE